MSTPIETVAAPEKYTGESDHTQTLAQIARVTHQVGGYIVRYGLALIIAWIGVMKFFEFEAKGISGLVANSPLLSWTYHFLSIRAFSSGLGCVELVTALLLCTRHFAPKLSVIGGVLAVPMFLTTLSFLITTPGVWDPAIGGFPFVGDLAGFLIKDVVLLGAAIWSLGDSLVAVTTERSSKAV